MTRKFLLSGFGVCLLAFGGIAQADPIDLYGYSLAIDGGVSDVIDWYAPLDPLPAGVNASGFDTTTGLGEIVITVMGAGAHSVLAFFDHELDEFANSYFNEYGGTGGTVAAGQSWEIDEPGYVFGDIYDNFVDNTLTNSNDIPLADCCDDISMAMGWNFTLAAGETGTISFLVGESNPGGFWLSQSDDTSATQIFLSSTLRITGGPVTVPEPGTLWLLGAGLLGLGLSRRRNLAES